MLLFQKVDESFIADNMNFFCCYLCSLIEAIDGIQKDKFITT